MSMNDGNKESIKELLSTFRTLFAINVSALFLILNLYAQGRLLFKGSTTPFWIGIGIAGLSVASTVYLFLLAIPKIFREEDSIAYQTDVIALSIVSVALFFIGYGILAPNISLTHP